MTPVTRVVAALRGIRATCLNAEPDGSLYKWLDEAGEALKEYDEFLHVEKVRNGGSPNVIKDIFGPKAEDYKVPELDETSFPCQELDKGISK